MNNKFEYDHSSFIVKNIDKSLKWYVENCDAEILYSSEDWALMNIYGTKLALSTGVHPPHIAFRCKKDTLYSIEDIKIKHRDGSEAVYIQDLDGNAIELITYE